MRCVNSYYFFIIGSNRVLVQLYGTLAPIPFNGTASEMEMVRQPESAEGGPRVRYQVAAVFARQINQKRR